MCDEINPNTIDEATKIEWLSQLDGMIKSELLDNFARNDTDADVSEFSGYTEDVPRTTVLLVPYPYDDIYVNYLVAQVFLMMGENSKYNNYAMMYEGEKETYEQYYSRTHKPNKTKHFNYF